MRPGRGRSRNPRLKSRPGFSPISCPWIWVDWDLLISGRPDDSDPQGLLDRVLRLFSSAEEPRWASLKSHFQVHPALHHTMHVWVRDYNVGIFHLQTQKWPEAADLLRILAIPHHRYLDVLYDYDHRYKLARFLRQEMSCIVGSTALVHEGKTDPEAAIVLPMTALSGGHALIEVTTHDPHTLNHTLRQSIPERPRRR